MTASPIFMQAAPGMHAALAVLDTEVVTFLVVEVVPGVFIVGGQFNGQEPQTLGTADSFKEAASIVTEVMEQNGALPAFVTAEFTPLPVGVN